MSPLMVNKTMMLSLPRSCMSAARRLNRFVGGTMHWRRAADRSKRGTHIASWSLDRWDSTTHFWLADDYVGPSRRRYDDSTCKICRSDRCCNVRAPA